MKDEHSNYFGFVCFFLLIIAIVIVGSITLYKSHNSKLIDKKSPSDEVIINDKMKVEKEEDFLYYVDEITTDETNLVYKKAVINLNSEDAKEINETLEKFVDTAKDSIVKSDETENICENGSELFSYNSLDYSVYSYEKYITLVVTENNNNCKDDISKPTKIHSYTFDVLTGNMISFDELLKKHNISL